MASYIEECLLKEKEIKKILNLKENPFYRGIFDSNYLFDIFENKKIQARKYRQGKGEKLYFNNDEYIPVIKTLKAEKYIEMLDFLEYEVGYNQDEVISFLGIIKYIFPSISLIISSNISYVKCNIPEYKLTKNIEENIIKENNLDFISNTVDECWIKNEIPIEKVKGIYFPCEKFSRKILQPSIPLSELYKIRKILNEYKINIPILKDEKGKIKVFN